MLVDKEKLTLPATFFDETFGNKSNKEVTCSQKTCSTLQLSPNIVLIIFYRSKNIAKECINVPHNRSLINILIVKLFSSKH